MLLLVYLFWGGPLKRRRSRVRRGGAVPKRTSLGREEYYACIDRCFWSERDSMSLSTKAGARTHGCSGRFGCLGGVGDGGDIMKTIAPQMTRVLYLGTASIA